ncbi:MAG: RNA polymerase factor sigma-32 [Proteobacteria bacterium]|jgi:RNA polymerase sigma-32 factor|nr:RNA polymerase factor sigma-32 [Pseudomonadota bacterium]
MNERTGDRSDLGGASRGAKDGPPARSADVVRYDPLEAFLREIQQYPLLGPEDERMLAEKYVATGDVQAAARLVTSNLRLVVKIAFEYRRAYRNIMDLVQEGNIGLMHAVKKFDPTRGVKLSSYAAWWIRAYILRFILNNWRLVKLGTTQSQRKLFFNLNKERQRLRSMGIEPTSAALAERMGVAEREVDDMERRLKADDVSLDAEINDAEGRSLTRLDLIADPGALQDSLFQDADFDDAFKKRLHSFGAQLTGKEQFIFQNRLVGGDPLTLQEIGDKFGVSRERIRQIERRLLDKLRSYLTSEMPGFFDGEEVS